MAVNAQSRCGARSGAVLLAFDAVYLELVLRLTTDQTLFVRGSAGGLCTALALALLFAALCSLFKGERAAWRAGVVCASLMTVWFLFCALTYDAYKVFMPPDIILSQAGNAARGIVFEDFYQPAWGGSTSTGEYSFLTGLAPIDPMVMMASRSANMYFTMGNQLRRLGYSSFAYHDGSRTYYSRDLTLPNMGYDSFVGIGNGMEKGLTGGLFPESDKEMMDYTVPIYIESQPFSVYYMTISGHASYAFKSDINDMSVKNQSVTEGLDYSEPVRAYLAANQELEYALESLVGQLEDAGIADDTVIAFVPDHYPYGLLPSNAWGGQTGLLEELYGAEATTCRGRDHNAAIIWSACLEDDAPITVSKPVSSIDILPTLSNLFGVEYDSRLLAGRDVFSGEEGLVFWNDGCWLTEHGYYDTHQRAFTPTEGAEAAGETYITRVSAMVADRLSLSRIIENEDYYGFLFN